jgi:histidinol phosphatase-like enzyme
MPRNPVIAVDFDNTIVDWLDSERCILKPGSREALKTLKKKGCTIVIHTCRIGIAKSNGDLSEVLDSIRSILDEFDVPYDSIHLGTKAIADAYIDDRAIQFRDNWQETLLETEKLVFRD